MPQISLKALIKPFAIRAAEYSCCTSNYESNANDRKEGSMKKGYWVVAYRSISDASAVKAYGALAVPAVQSFGGRFLTGSMSQMQVHEAGLQQRTILVEFDSYDIARSAHET